MALNIRASAETLHRRIAAQEKKEANFEKARLDAAAAMEKKVLDSEAQSRRIVDELKVRIDREHSLVVEKERTTCDALQRLAAVQGEYDNLLAIMAKTQKKDDEEHVEVKKAQQKVDALTRALQELRVEMQDLSRRNAFPHRAQSKSCRVLARST